MWPSRRRSLRIYRARTAQRGVRLLRGQLSAFAYGFPLPKWSTVQRFVLESLVDDEFITVEIDDNGCGRLKFELPLDVTEAEIEYIQSLVPRAESGTLELLDPNTGEVVFVCTPVLVH